MDDNTKVANTQVEGTTQQETTPVEQTAQPTEQTVAKQTETVDRFDKHPRFQELNRRVKEAEAKLALYEQQRTQVPEVDPYAGLPEQEAQQTKLFIEKYVIPEVEKRVEQKYDPFVKQFQGEQLNKQIESAKAELSKFNINFDEKLPEVVEYLSRPENRGRLTATEAARNLYFDDMLSQAKTKSKEEVAAEQQELMEKKKLANLQTSTVAPKSVIQTDELARSKMTEAEKMEMDIRNAIAKAKAGERNPKVKR